MGTKGRHWAKAIRIVERNEVIKDAQSVAIFLDVTVSLIYQVLRGEKNTASGFHLEWVEDKK